MKDHQISLLNSDKIVKLFSLFTCACVCFGLILGDDLKGYEKLVSYYIHKLNFVTSCLRRYDTDFYQHNS